MNKKTRFSLIMAVGLIAVLFFAVKIKSKTKAGEAVKEISPTIGSIQAIISATGTVLPKNRLQVKPPVNGRVESIIVKEGQNVKTGQTLAWMSSMERAALLDAARAETEEKLKYWQDVYKPIMLVAPIDGEVIVASIQPGQTVTSSDAVIVLSDKLIVRAQADETDISKIKLGQDVIVSIDAYPDTKIKAAVEHIYYESKTVNNVTIYEVDIIPDEIPAFVRSGMNAAVNFIEKSKQDALLVPLEAVFKENNENFVLIKQNGNKQAKRSVQLGISDDENVEIISGIDGNDKIIIKSDKYVLPKNNGGKNPFMPAPRRNTSGR